MRVHVYTQIEITKNLPQRSEYNNYHVIGYWLIFFFKSPIVIWDDLLNPIKFSGLSADVSKKRLLRSHQRNRNPIKYTEYLIQIIKVSILSI